MNFEQWWQALQAHARTIGQADLININDQESYREYFEDGDSPQEVVAMELSYVVD